MHQFNKVLLVDDDEATNFLTGLVFKKLKIAKEVQVAEDGVIACDLINKNSCPDIIFLDIRMPRMDGFDFLDHINKMNVCPNVKIVMLTSSLRQEDKMKALSYKYVIEYFEKPLTADMIQDIAVKYF